MEHGACLGLCADGLTLYAFGGCDGETDLDDLWALELLPTDTAEPAEDAGSTSKRPAAHHALPQARRGDAPFNPQIFKARQARACAVLHATPGFGNKEGTSIHDLVSQAWRLRCDVR